MLPRLNLIVGLLLSAVLGEAAGFWPFAKQADVVEPVQLEGKQVAIIGMQFSNSYVVSSSLAARSRLIGAANKVSASARVI